MAFLNESTISPNISATNLTGSTLISGTTNLANLKIPQNRRLLSYGRSTVTQAAGTGTASETIATSISYAAGTFMSGDSIDFTAIWGVTSNNALNKTFTVRLGTAGTTSDAIISQVAAGGTSVSYFTPGRVVFMTNNSFDAHPTGGQNTVTNLTISPTVNLSGSTTYITFTGTRSTPSADTIYFSSYEIFLNKVSN